MPRSRSRALWFEVFDRDIATNRDIATMVPARPTCAAQRGRSERDGGGVGRGYRLGLSQDSVIYALPRALPVGA